MLPLWLKKLAASLACFFLAWTPSAFCWADAFTDISKSGQSYGSDIFPDSSSLFSGGGSGGVVLNPGSENETPLSQSDIFDLPSNQAPTEQESLYGDNNAMQQAVSENNTRLETEDSYHAEAYRMLQTSMQNNSHPDMRNDPIWGQTDAVLEDVFSGNFADCEQTTTVVGDSFTARIPELRTCEKVKGSSSCERRREVSQVDYNPGTRCTPGEVVAGPFDGRKSTWTYHCGSDGKSITTGGGARVLPYGEDARVGDSYWTQIQTCVDNGSTRTCTLSGGTYSRYHPDIGGKSHDYDYLHSRSSDTYTILSYEAEDLDVIEDIYSTPQNCAVSDSFCQTKDWECLEVDNDRVFNKILGFAHGDGGLKKCGDGCLDLYIGKVGDNYWDGNCTIFERDVVVELYNPGIIQSAVISQVVYDDYMQIYLGGQKVWNGPNNNFPPETGGACELSTSRNDAISVDVTNSFKQEGMLEFKIRTSVTGGGGEGYARIRLRFDPAEGPVTLTPEVAGLGLQPLYPGDPMEDVCWKAVAERDCSFNVGQMECWTDTSGVEHCPENTGEVQDTCGALEDDPNCGFVRSECVEGARDPDSGICYVHTEVYDCGVDVEVDTATQQQSYTCPGEIRCMGNECVSKDQNASKDFQKAAALLNAADFIGMDLKCNESGSSCKVFGGDNFQCKKAVGGWQDCCDMPAGVSLKDYLDLLIGSYKVASAKKWLAGAMDNPLYGSWTAIESGVTSTAEALSTPVREGATQVWSKMTQPFSQAWESVSGSIGKMFARDAATTAGEKVVTTATGEVAKGAIQKTVQIMTDKLASWVMEKFGTTGFNMLFTSGAGTTFTTTTTTNGMTTTVVTDATGKVVEETTKQAAQGVAEGTTQNVSGSVLGGYIGSALTVIMWAYLAYSIANILVQIIWECEEQEFELGTKRELKVCTYLGSYCKTEVLGACVEKRESFCCYQSPLSRILNEQIRGQIGPPYGDKESPNCEGVPLEKLEQVDWDQINLDEWIAILKITGNLPDANSAGLNMDALTGSGSTFNVDDQIPRSDVKDRTLESLASPETKDINEDLRQGLWGN